MIKLRKPSVSRICYPRHSPPTTTRYTGELIVKLIARECTDIIRQGHVILSGRSGEKIGALVKNVFPETDLAPQVATMAFSVGMHRVENIQHVLRESGTHVLLNCAGPFVSTARPLIQACLRSGVSYLDITGEWGVFEYALNGKEIDSEAVAKKDIVIMPGVGYDVVPSDCCIATLAEAYREKFDDTPHGIEVAMTFGGDSGITHGTAKSMVHGAAEGMHARRDGKIVPVPLFHSVKDFTLPNGNTRSFSSVSWGDISTGYYSSGGVPNIDIYFPANVPKFVALIFQLHLVQLAMHFIFRLPFVVSLMCKLIEMFLPRGPTQQQLDRGTHTMIGYAYNRERSQSVSLHCNVTNGYKLTSETALVSALRVLVGKTRKYGCLTPTQAFGKDFINEFDGCKMELVDGKKAK